MTDAQLVLGRLTEDSFLGGRVNISHRLAEAAIEEKIARPMGLDLLDAAAGVVRIATAHMVAAIELNSVRRGYDPRDFHLVAFGGAGPLFAGDIARELSIRGTIVPRFPGIVAAMGLLASDVVHASSVSLVRLLAGVPFGELADRFGDMEAKAVTQLRSEGFGEPDTILRRYAECRFAGQGYEIRVPAGSGPIDELWIAELAAAFHDEHRREYSHDFPDGAVELVTIGVEAVGLLDAIDLSRLPSNGRVARSPRTRDVWFEETGCMVATTTHMREDLTAGARVAGPALIAQEDSTVLVPPGSQAMTDPAGNILISEAAE